MKDDMNATEEDHTWGPRYEKQVTFIFDMIMHFLYQVKPFNFTENLRFEYPLYL
jgi:hypothetical protein